MTIRHNFFVFFGLFYFGLLTAGILAGLVLGHLTGLNAGFVINVICFCAAVQLSATRWGARYVYVEGPSPAGLQAVVRQRKYSLCLGFAVIAITIDMFYFVVFSLYFKGAVQDLNLWRPVLMVLAYGGISYYVLIHLGDGNKSRG